MDYQIPELPFDGSFDRSAFPHVAGTRSRDRHIEIPTEYPLDTDLFVNRGALHVDAQVITPLRFPEEDRLEPDYEGVYVRHFYYLCAFVRRNNVPHVFWLHDHLSSYVRFTQNYGSPIRPYELADHEIESAENEYFLRHGYSRTARDSVKSAIDSIESALIKGVEAAKRTEYLGILCQAGHVNEWECAVHEVSHAIKQMNPRPHNEDEALDIYERDAVIPHGLQAKITALLAATSPEYIRGVHNTAWPGANEKILGRDARLSRLAVQPNNGPEIVLKENLEAELVATTDVEFAADATGIRVGLALSDPNATMEVSDGTTTSTIFNFPTTETTKKLTIIVTAEDGHHTNRYVVNINRAVAAEE